VRAHLLREQQAFLRYLEVPGADPPILWIHGWQCSSTGELAGAAVQPALAGRRSLLVDLLGHGYSDRPPEFGYTLVAHARNVVDLIEALGISTCTLVGHSMGADIGIHVASMRPAVVTSLVMAEGNIDPRPARDDVGNCAEPEFVTHGYEQLLARQAATAFDDPDGIAARHLGITRACDPRALHREDLSMAAGESPTRRELLGALPALCTYLVGEFSEPDPEFDEQLQAVGISRVVVPDTGHAMGLQNPAGLAQAVADTLASS
jgi:pimeloyl-ACP methyl ester carboxylesterase